MFQLGCQVVMAYWALKLTGIAGCDFATSDILSYLAYALLGLNLIALITIRCSAKFPRCFFFTVFFLDLVLAAGIIAINATKGYSACAPAKVFYHFSIIESAIKICLCFAIFFMRLAWGQRYTNSPGNLVWPPLFLSFQWSSLFAVYMQIIGIATAVTSILTFVINLSTIIKTSTSTRKLVTFGWIFGIALLLILEGLAIFKYLTAGNVNEYTDVQAKSTLAVFIGVNLIDILFWMWGMKSLDYEKGDQVREDLFVGKEDFSTSHNQQIEKSVIVESNFGTIKK